MVQVLATHLHIARGPLSSRVTLLEEDACNQACLMSEKRIFLQQGLNQPSQVRGTLVTRRQRTPCYGKMEKTISIFKRNLCKIQFGESGKVWLLVVFGNFAALRWPTWICTCIAYGTLSLSLWADPKSPVALVITTWTISTLTRSPIHYPIRIQSVSTSGARFSD